MQLDDIPRRYSSLTVFQQSTAAIGPDGSTDETRNIVQRKIQIWGRSVNLCSCVCVAKNPRECCGETDKREEDRRCTAKDERAN
jgi:hypothetical protein